MAHKISSTEKKFLSRSTDECSNRHSVFIPPVIETQNPVTKLRLKQYDRSRSVHNTPYRRNESQNYDQHSHAIQIDHAEHSNQRNPSLLHPSQRSILEVSPSRTEARSEVSGDYLGGQNFIMINPIEYAKYENNHKFGLPKWKSHLATRPLAERSPQVQALYYPVNKTIPNKVNFCTTFGNIVYCICLGWWVSLIYLFFGVIMFMTICGYHYGFYSFRLALYFLWPFGKFIYVPSKSVSPTRRQYSSEYENVELSQSHNSINYDSITRIGGINTNSDKPGFDPSLPNGIFQPPHDPNPDDTAPLVHSEKNSTNSEDKFTLRKESLIKLVKRFFTVPNICKYPFFWLWVFLAVPFLFFIHLLVFIFTWAFVISIPIAKVHKTAMFKLLYLDPKTTKIENSDWILGNSEHDVVLCTYQAYSRYYVKYTVDGMNVIMFNMFFLVIIALVFNYTIQFMGISERAQHFTKFIISIFGVIPLAYYIGMAIASISAQSTYAVGAVLNATFGSIVEITLYIATLVHGNSQKTVQCSQSIVKNSLTGSLLLTMLLLPGLCMVVGGLKYPEQNFNARSAGVSSTLLFVSIVGAFAPTFFNKAFGDYFCESCEWVPSPAMNITNSTVNNNTNVTYAYNETESSFQCRTCQYLTSSYTFIRAQYLAYVCMVLLPIAYIAGMLYSLKTHKHIYTNASEGQGKGTSAHWGRLKSTFILVLMTILMSLLADTIAENVMHVLSSVEFVTPAFLGSTVYAILPDVPELVTGIQFALQGIISLSIEVGNQIAVQICLLQIPVLLLADLIYKPLGFVLLFNDLQIFSVLMSVLVINYIFSDSKTDYFQGTSLLVIFFIMLSVIFLAPDDARENCYGND